MALHHLARTLALRRGKLLLSSSSLLQAVPTFLGRKIPLFFSNWKTSLDWNPIVRVKKLDFAWLSSLGVGRKPGGGKAMSVGEGRAWIPGERDAPHARSPRAGVIPLQSLRV